MSWPGTDMNPDPVNLPMPLAPAPDSQADPLDAVLAEPLALAAAAQPAPGPDSPLRQRLLARVDASRQAEAGMHTVRQRHLRAQPLADGVSGQLLYQADAGRTPRRGEPLRALILLLAPGARLDTRVLADRPLANAANAPAAQPVAPASPDAVVQEWLVMDGQLLLDGQALSLRDYHRRPASAGAVVQAGPQGARVFVREARAAADAPGSDHPADPPLTVLDRDAGWPEFAPGIQRRVLWQADGQAALLYHALPGAAVPRHRHGHDEECLMVQGELYLDDLLLQTGDYQLAPAGSGHRITQTDTGVVIYAHGDLDLQFIA